MRNVIAALLALALTATAVAARPAKTAPPPPDTAMVTVGTGDQATQAFVAWPAKRAGAAGIVVAHDRWGLDDQNREVARRLSREGYVAIVPDLYHGQVATDADAAQQLAASLDEGRALDDLTAAITWLREQPDMQKSKLGVVGFSVGGRLSEKLALAHPELLTAAVMFYGKPESDPEALKTLAVPLQAHFGATDSGNPPSHADELRRGLQAAGKDAEVYVYPGAGHGFMSDGSPSFHRDAARQAWARMLAFFQRHLRG